MKPTRLDYCQYLLSSQVNYTLTNYADHHEHFSHDAINRYLRGERLTSRMIWENVKPLLEISENGVIIFDDSVLDKNYSHKIELVRRQYSGNAHGIIKGIGMVNCVYLNPENGHYWIIDYRIFEPDADGKTKLDHVRDILTSVLADKLLPFRTVLMDTWYATKELMVFIESQKKIYYCPIRENRLVDDSCAARPYRPVSELMWGSTEYVHGKVIKIKGFPKEHRVKLFRVVVSSNRTDWVVTNDLSQDSTLAVQEACRLRWTIEQFHREIKQLTGIEKCQCRKSRMQRNHIACAVLVWMRLSDFARKAGKTIYAVKKGLLEEYLRHELKNPAVAMAFA